MSIDCPAPFVHLVVALLALAAVSIAQEAKKNVLFVVVDDLRPELGCYGSQVAKTPHLDDLARSSVLFERAYVQQAVCSPSRTSVMTGLRPDSTRVYDLVTSFRKTVPDVVTLPQLFAKHGWHAEGVGKIYHGKLNDARSWSAPWRSSRGSRWADAKTNRRIAQRVRAAKKSGARGKALDTIKRGPPVECLDVEDVAYPDGWLARHAIRRLRVLRDGEQPFFLALGFVKPHLPFCAPKKYWDLYDREAIRLPARQTWPDAMPRHARANWGELRKYEGMPKKGAVTEQQARELIHGYFACVSYVDAQIGKVLAELERLGIAQDTIVVVWGDHGWKLGNYGAWCKHTNLELDVRVPLLVRAPGAKANGQRTRALVELVDLYPTLVELCGLPIPEHLEGDSFVPLLEDTALSWKRAAFSQYPRRARRRGGRDRVRLMGHSMRTDRWRLTEWRASGETRSYAVELYDHRRGFAPDANVAAEHPEVVRRLLEQLRAGFQDARPKR